MSDQKCAYINLINYQFPSTAVNLNYVQIHKVIPEIISYIFLFPSTQIYYFAEIKSHKNSQFTLAFRNSPQLNQIQFKSAHIFALFSLNIQFLLCMKYDEKIYIIQKKELRIFIIIKILCTPQNVFLT